MKDKNHNMVFIIPIAVTIVVLIGLFLLSRYLVK